VRKGEQRPKCNREAVAMRQCRCDLDVDGMRHGMVNGCTKNAARCVDIVVHDAMVRSDALVVCQAFVLFVCAKPFSKRIALLIEEHFDHIPPRFRRHVRHGLSFSKPGERPWTPVIPLFLPLPIRR